MLQEKHILKQKMATLHSNQERHSSSDDQIFSDSDIEANKVLFNTNLY